ncbi:MAG: flagellin, partial [Myxococcales bacterium]
SLGADDRQYLDNEFQSLNQEISRIQESTQFSGNKLISGTDSVGTLKFQVGLTDDANDQIEVSFANLDFGVGTLALTDGDTARTVLTQIDAGIDNVSQARATFGTAVNRLEVATNNIQTMRLNISAANSRIRDVDVADESAKMAKSQVLSQSSVSILAQANQLPQLAYKLIGG